MSDPPAFSVRRSRAGGNPDLGISGIFQDCCNFKLLDSRLRGNDGGGFGKIAPPVFRRPFASSVFIVAWALPTIMLGKKGRLKF